jgi:hypothetical protein
MKLPALILSVLLSLTAAASFADAPAAGNTPPAGGMCKANPQGCTQLAQQFDQWCSANADTCVRIKAHIEKHREFCEQNKDKCQAMREKMRARMQQRCQANPSAPHCQDKQNPPGDDNGDDDDDDTGL